MIKSPSIIDDDGIVSMDLVGLFIKGNVTTVLNNDSYSQNKELASNWSTMKKER